MRPHPKVSAATLAAATVAVLLAILTGVGVHAAAGLAGYLYPARRSY